ncbi:uncharacterized protein YecE (DUF72 family) [Sphingomonas vulcanisoli]|uniref:Uncharacterized protein YecE (DUF72 family) n=1 Tax=Sphingomonas vulcanisoli TaxID=1658060 RepID=A0ABX0TQW4_9SPHN|nr:DUF72 domain-containing protein [Sphingomonas vulcanisoli]NIJ07918.1 uncharacterized protein YecE (DUF72 family) [Sphingomonas vulcanisoli]
MQRVGTAGWSIPAAVAARFPAEGSGLERYAAVFNAVEINSSFHRPHRRATYERWAAAVPEGFRFAVKLPKAITHEARLVNCETLLAAFAEGVGGLGNTRGPVLVQLPPSLVFDAEIAEAFFPALSAALPGAIACEPRHASWFSPKAETSLVKHKVARVAADPAKIQEAAEPGGWRALTYRRFHGSPRIYYSAYDPDQVADHVASGRNAPGEVWTIYDNTASGAATEDALTLRDMLAQTA